MFDTPLTYVYFNAIISTAISNTKFRHLSQMFVDGMCELFARSVWPKLVFFVFCFPISLQVTFYDTIRLEN